MSLEEIIKEIAICRACDIWEHYKVNVPPEGDLAAGLMFVGRDPGREEVEQGRPFVGQAGRKLDALLRSLGIDRKSVFITNLVKCRPLNNIAPPFAKAKFCADRFLKREIEAVSPKVIVCLGAEAARYLTGQVGAMSRIRGNVYRYGDIPVIPTWHPSYLVRLEKMDPGIYADRAWEMYSDVEKALRIV